MSWTDIATTLSALKTSVETLKADSDSLVAEKEVLVMESAADMVKTANDLIGEMHGIILKLEDNKELTDDQKAQQELMSIQAQKDCVRKLTREADGRITAMEFSSAALEKKGTILKSYRTLQDGRLSCCGVTLNIESTAAIAEER